MRDGSGYMGHKLLLGRDVNGSVAQPKAGDDASTGVAPAFRTIQTRTMQAGENRDTMGVCFPLRPSRIPDG